jgi:glycosyltransferase involved in cell wall biosynthesis
VDIQYENSVSIVQHARNKLATTFLTNTKADYCLFLDDDVEFNPSDILEMIQADVDVIGAIYPYKHYNWENVVNTAVATKDPNASRLAGINYAFTNPSDQLTFQVSKVPQEVAGIGTGVLLIRRSVFHQLINLLGLENITYTLNKASYYKFFDVVVEDGEMVSEDFWFCRRWRECGGKVFAATWAKCIHWGTHRYGA